MQERYGISIVPMTFCPGSLAPTVMSVTSFANDKGDNELIQEAVCRSPGIFTAEENSRKPQLGDSLIKGLCD